MKCPVCKKQLGGVTLSGWNWRIGGPAQNVPYHMGKNGKPCTGSGQPPK